MQRVIRPAVTILLLLVSLFLPIIPAIEGFENGNATCSHACCRRNRVHCGPSTHKDTPGLSWTAGPACPTACLFFSIVSRTSAALRIHVPSASPLPLIAKSLGKASAFHIGFRYSPSLYQRPPPLCLVTPVQVS